MRSCTTERFLSGVGIICMVLSVAGHADLTALSPPIGLNPFRAPEPLPILNPSNFVPKNGFPVVKALTGVLSSQGTRCSIDYTNGKKRLIVRDHVFAGSSVKEPGQSERKEKKMLQGVVAPTIENTQPRKRRK